MMLVGMKREGGGGGGGEGWEGEDSWFVGWLEGEGEERVKMLKKREKKRWTQMDEQTANVGPTPSLNLISSGK